MSSNLDKREVRAPFDNRVLGEVSLTDSDLAEKALSTAADLHQSKLKPTLAERIEILRRVVGIMSKNKEELALQAANEGGKPLIDSLVEIERGIDGVEVCIEVLRGEQGHVIPMRVTPSSANRLAFTQSFPVGPVMAVSAFNHPFNLIVHQCIPAIAVGCPVIVKPAEATPMSAHSISKMLIEAGLPAGWCQVVNTTDLTVASKLVTDPRISFFSFIGSGAVGWRLRSQLAPGTRCGLEHGGVAPVIIEPDADKKRVVQSITKGGFYHAGQVCVSVQRVFVHEDIFDDIADALKNEAEKLNVGDPANKNTEVGPLINHGEADRVATWVDEAIAGGAIKITGGKRLSDSTYAPTILIDPPENANISTKEVFGPVIALFKYSNIDEAISRANGLDFAFQAAIFTSDIDRSMHAYARLNASAVMINDHTAFRTDWMPFAGLGVSGHGVGGMAYTMHEMSIEKMLVMNSPALSGL
ncbi:MAG: aldehyde dehydrogenase family protein [Rhodospirillaceae bacterium]|jgi:acyl-CoA reductase-like NAD-dependent aldehyde dehydrogenase|nr:aldehyde dehydrogenase family protein [Rhodospirillaceae bacterium]MDC0998617.1 aldehyde dehydrogenase family protein [Alphaproteobacteria bacterium]MBT5914187.1 aldehyde dehydrogenase family protein [Rhodospirillaceae bacterium]MBT6304634.1 aldehyde dehydrogenase family protein [Rhodospirillaceae bacterium]MBT7732927.1 aldehyde dehydrogenase family protein [Rhodospirillaceae bacterium]|tara:strand:+ start:5103 stop:6515 length:1413 start_codon:yes stop_codon:yes gene_type:complete